MEADAGVEGWAVGGDPSWEPVVGGRRPALPEPVVNQSPRVVAAWRADFPQNGGVLHGVA